jgi:hypothetical protein
MDEFIDHMARGTLKEKVYSLVSILATSIEDQVQPEGVTGKSGRKRLVEPLLSLDSTVSMHFPNQLEYHSLPSTDCSAQSQPVPRHDQIVLSRNQSDVYLSPSLSTCQSYARSVS